MERYRTYEEPTLRNTTTIENPSARLDWCSTLGAVTECVFVLQATTDTGLSRWAPSTTGVVLSIPRML